MFVKETWRVLVTWSEWLTKLTAFFRVLDAKLNVPLQFKRILLTNLINLLLMASRQPWSMMV